MINETEWTPLRQYRDFWDVPQMFVIEHDGSCLLFDSPFDGEVEDYAGSYAVYQLPAISDEELKGQWDRFPNRALRTLGSLALSQVQFDPTHRASVRWSPANLTARPLPVRTASPPSETNRPYTEAENIGRA